MKEWFTPAEIAALKIRRMPTTDRAVQLMADRDGWRLPENEFPANPRGCWRKRGGRGGGYEYRITVLPRTAQLDLLNRAKKAAPAPEAPPEEEMRGDLKRRSLWSQYNKLSDRQKDAAKRKFDVLTAAEELVRNGEEKTVAYMWAATKAGISERTLYNWAERIYGVPREDWLPALANRYAGRLTETDCTPEAFDFIVSDYLRSERPGFSSCYRRLQKAATHNGWTIPSEKTLQRRVKASVHEIGKVRLRDGEKAAERLYPAQERDKTGLYALWGVNGDGHVMDVFVKWPGEAKPVRPIIVAFQDIYSGRIMSWRIARAETAHAILLAFGDLVEQWGIPERCWLDNGRAFASKSITGGIANRYRFKVKANDPDGVMKNLGVEVHWATPYHGQAKPIERAFRDFAEDIAKDPRFAGAYTGNKPDAKPENYGSKAVPLELFEQVFAEGVADHNARSGRRSKVCAGRSFDEAFLASYETAIVRKALPEQKQLWLLMAEGVMVRRDTGVIHLYGNRFWSDAVANLRGTKVLARFDPEALADGIHVYRLDGTYVAFAECIEMEGFQTVGEAREHMANKRAVLRGHKMIAEAEARMSMRQLADFMPPPKASPVAPESKVVRPVFRRGGAAVAAAAVQQQEDFERSQEEMLAALARGVRLHLVENDDDADG